MITLDELADLMIEIKPDSMSIIEQKEYGFKIDLIYEKDGKEYKNSKILSNMDIESYKGDIRDVIKLLFRESI